MTTYYIGPSGDDTTGDGSSGNPWKTLSKATGETLRGDIIIVLQGTNVMGIDQNIGRIGGITIKGETDDPRDTIIDFGNNEWLISTSNEVDDIIENLTLYRGNNPNNRNENFETANLGGSMTFNNVIFKEIITGANNDYRNTQGGFFTTNNTYSNAIFNFNVCIFQDIYTKVDGDYSKLIFFAGIHDVSYNLSNCIIYRSSKSVPSGYTSRFAVFNGYSPQTIKNSILVDDSGSDDCYLYSTYSLPTTTLNIYNSCIHNIIIASNPSTYTLPTDTNITTDPQFIDPINEDYRLIMTSPCINGGVITNI